MEKGDIQADEITDANQAGNILNQIMNKTSIVQRDIEASRARYVLNAKTDEEELLFDKLEIIRINMKDPQTKKQIFKNRRDQGIQILREYVEKNQKYLTITES